jgi:hypothetical protein
MTKKQRTWTIEQRRAASEKSRQSLRERRARGEAVDISWGPKQIDQTWRGK